MGSYQQFKYKKHFIRKNVFMRKHMFLNITVVVALMLAISFCMACSGGQADNHEKIDYTVVENEDLPIELKKLIDNKKQSTLRLTYTTKDYTYIVAGYGVVLTSFTCSPSAGPISLKSAYTALPLTYTSSTLMLYPDVSLVPYPATI